MLIDGPYPHTKPKQGVMYFELFDIFPFLSYSFNVS